MEAAASKAQRQEIACREVDLRGSGLLSFYSLRRSGARTVLALGSYPSHGLEHVEPLSSRHL